MTKCCVTRLDLSLEAASGARAVGGSVFTEILREEMLRTLEHAERYGWGV